MARLEQHRVRDAGGPEPRGLTQVQEAVPYLDPIEGKDREADVVADFGPIRMVVECKSSEASPWVAIAPTGQMWSPELPTFMIPESGPIRESWIES